MLLVNAIIMMIMSVDVAEDLEEMTAVLVDTGTTAFEMIVEVMELVDTKEIGVLL
jgi:hypothetical protein